MPPHQLEVVCQSEPDTPNHFPTVVTVIVITFDSLTTRYGLGVTLFEDVS